MGKSQRKNLIIVGAGGHGKVVAEVALLTGFNVVGFLDDDPRKIGRKILGIPVLGTTNEDDILRVISKYSVESAIIGVGNNIVRAELYYKLIDYGIEMATIIHPQAWVSKYVRIGQGTVILSHAVVNTDTIIGDNVVINTGAKIEHDCIIMHHSFIGPQATVTGGVKVGYFSYVYSSAIIVPGVEIGNNSVIGAGAVVLRNIPSNTVAVGVPASPIRRNEDTPTYNIIQKLHNKHYHTIIFKNG